MRKWPFGVIAMGLLACSCSASTPSSTTPAHSVQPSFEVRPVLCWAPAFASQPGEINGSPAGRPSCSQGYQLTATNLGIKPDPSNAEGYDSNASVAPDPTLASYPTTAHGADEPLNTVILPAWPPAANPPNVRFVLGPAALTATSVQGVEVLNQSGQWMVNVTLTPSGAASWDALASTHFHTFLAVVVNGLVVSAAITEPVQSSFTSYGGQVEISGGFSEDQAKALAVQI